MKLLLIFYSMVSYFGKKITYFHFFKVHAGSFLGCAYTGSRCTAWSKPLSGWTGGTKKTCEQHCQCKGYPEGGTCVLVSDQGRCSFSDGKAWSFDCKGPKTYANCLLKHFLAVLKAVALFKIKNSLINYNLFCKFWLQLHCSPGFGLLGKTTFNPRYDDITVVVGLVRFVILIDTRFQHYKKMVE